MSNHKECFEGGTRKAAGVGLGGLGLTALGLNGLNLGFNVWLQAVVAYGTLT